MPETCIVITVPETDGKQVLVRLPGHLMSDSIQVDFRPGLEVGIRVWTPSGFFEGSVEVRHQ